MYDAGLTPAALARNLDVLQVPVRELRAYRDFAWPR